MDETLRSVIEVVRHHTDGGSPHPLDDPDLELTSIGFDSLKKVCLLLDLERSLGVRFPATMIDAENFRTLRTVADSIRALKDSPT
jgi:acyl carrier protein